MTLVVTRRHLMMLAAGLTSTAALAACGASGSNATPATAARPANQANQANPGSSAGPAAPATTRPQAGPVGPTAPGGGGGASIAGKSLGVAEFRTLMDTPGTVLLDVRTPAEFAAGHLKGARNIDVESPTFAAEVGKLDKTATYAIYCRTASRSKAAMDIMRQGGIAKVADLAGGIVAWQAAGGAVVK